jgi:DNA-binding response OmpR family regulator
MSQPLLLVVDDVPEIGLIVQRLGRRACQEVVWRSDAAGAWAYLVQAAEGRRPDLVLLDLNLPDLPGVELCRRLRGAAGLCDVPLALFTNWDQGGEIAVGLEAGARFVVCKDLLTRPEAWQARLAEILAAPRPREGNPVFALRCAGGRPLSAAFPGLRLALRHPTLRPLGFEVLGVLVRRALRQASCPWPAEILLDDFPSPGDPGAAEPLARAAALAEQVWCVLGGAGSAPFRAALAAALGD